ncbi:unnamed protein product [Zymoseptoria tritici ST99CH_3D1]|nr:unnamed protein product [Zymoseptoria tritici ST99CH_3D1]
MSLSPNPSAAVVPPSPHNGSVRPQLTRSSQSSNSTSTRHAAAAHASPGSAAGDHLKVRQQHHKPGRHAKVVLPRNHSSARNLVKYAEQHSRQRSHEGDTEIRLPGSLDEGRPAMKRNATAYQLPRNASSAKLKKNLSHGQLTRLTSGKNLMAMAANAQRAPTSPRLKGRSKRPKSADIVMLEKEYQERGAEDRNEVSAKEKSGGSRKVGFDVGSGDHDDEDDPQMEISGLQEDEWTEESASASPFSTRQNTANNSRRTSTVAEKKPAVAFPSSYVIEAKAKRHAERQQQEQQQEQPSAPPPPPRAVQEPSSEEEGEDEDEDEYEDDDEDEEVDADSEDASPASPRTLPRIRKESHPPGEQGESQNRDRVRPEPQQEPQREARPEPQPAPARLQAYPTDTRRSSIQSQHREHPNPAARHLLSKTQPNPAPALVSNVSALDDNHSIRGSPAPSLRSSRSNLQDGSADPEGDELVSRFVPSTSHPSGTNTAVSTPKQTGFHTPDQESSLSAQRREHHAPGVYSGPASPGSTVSGSSGATTPAIGRSRTEIRLLQDKALADREAAHDIQKPYLPAWQYDRLNKSLRSTFSLHNKATYIYSANVGPEIFQGRFRAVNTELRVVQKFRDPIGEATARLRSCKGSKLQQSRAAAPQKKSGGPVVPPGRNTISFPAAAAGSAAQAQRTSHLSKSSSPPHHQSSPLAAGAHNASAVRVGGEIPRHRREVSFAQTPPQSRQVGEGGQKELSPDVIARQLWDAV